MDMLILNGNVWRSGSFKKLNIVVRNGKIQNVNSNQEKSGIKENYKVIDAENQYILPGIIDCHVHLSMNGRAHPMAELSKSSEAEAAIVAALSSNKLLRSGITTIRECGGIAEESLIIKEAIENGEIRGPRIIPCINAIKIPGGHFVGKEITGPNESRRAARELIGGGARFIKLMATGGLGKIGEEPGVVELNVDEMEAAAYEGKKHGMSVAAHCHSKEGMMNALKAGATTLEHCTFLDEEVIDMMLEHDVFMVPTFSPYELISRYGKDSGVSTYMCRMAEEICEYKNKTFVSAYKRGVKIAFGRDAGAPFTKHEDYTVEMKAMEKAGMTKEDIIISATETAAKALNLYDEVGSIEKDKYADMIILSENPLIDLENFKKINYVIKEGKIV
ncbi:Xaa-Pro dipeptidase family enzyme [[Clostridium] ultunense Esp]|nr:Xaa-Pro dipeptidase family enzyme [[Clostridium] ultunense Esp]